VVSQGIAVLRPGWVRLNFNYFIADEEFQYLLGALELVAESGWRMLPEYRYDAISGVWRHRSWFAKNAANHGKTSHHKIEVIDWMTEQSAPTASTDQQIMKLDTEKALRDAKQMLFSTTALSSVADVDLNKQHDHLRWFMQPSEAKQLQHQFG
jgi:hypothetical protein